MTAVLHLVKAWRVWAQACAGVTGWIGVTALLCLPQPASAQPYTTAATAEGREIAFASIETVFATGNVIPATGWQRTRMQRIFQPGEMPSPPGTSNMMWARVRFDRAALDGLPLALYTIDNREQMVVLLNGAELYRNFAHDSDHMMGWYRPYLIPLPEHLLRPGTNEIVFRMESNHTVGVGQVVLGPHGVLQDRYLHMRFWRITAPTIANYAMLVLGALALFLWVLRREEVELLYLALAAGLWFVRNYHYFTDRLPFDIRLFDLLTLHSAYFATAASAAFCLTFIRSPRANAVIMAIASFGVILSVTHWLTGFPDVFLFAAGMLVALALGLFGLADLWRRRSGERSILAVVMLLLPLSAAHDVGRFNGVQLWDGAGYYFNPFLGFLFCIAFLAAFGKRALDSFDDLAGANATLEVRIAETRADLATSEEKRRLLEVGQAVAGERERLMREMHDGIGSNLITALAVAEQQGQPASTIKTLRRAIGDLKITVDSLEPVEGDLVALLGNLRHRMSRDLRDAGLTCRWSVEPCGNLAWLDATNALHVLRIFQEAIGNVLSHAGATEMTIGCRDEVRGGVNGIAAFISDNGCGFDPGLLDVSGKGLGNLRARALALHGQLDCETAPGEGAMLTLWLPYVRDRAGSARVG